MGSSTRRIAWPEFSTGPRAAVVLPLQHAALQCVCSCVHGLLAHVCVYYVLSSIKPIWMFMSIFDIQDVNGLVPFLWTVLLVLNVDIRLTVRASMCVHAAYRFGELLCVFNCKYQLQWRKCNTRSPFS